MSNSSNNTRKLSLSKLLFRRSSTNASCTPVKPVRNEICYQHQNRKHYENLMAFRNWDNGRSAGAGTCENENDQEDSEDENFPLIALAVPHLIEKNEESKSPLGRVVVFADKPKHVKNRSKLRARSSSPSKSFASSSSSSTNGSTNSSRLHGILKNSVSDRNYFCDKYNHDKSRGSETIRKSSLQRTKSSPVSCPSPMGSGRRKAIPVPIPSPPRLSDLEKKKSKSNPLLSVSWNCPTLEKRKDAILNYFKNLSSSGSPRKEKDDEKNESRKAEQLSDPIYEEIPDDARVDHLLESPKPKLFPKKVRLNLSPSFNDEEEGYYQHPKPPRPSLIARSNSFGSFPKNDWIGFESSDDDESRPKETKPSIDSTIISKDFDEPRMVKPKLTEGMASFATEVADHANKLNKPKPAIKSRSQSFNFGDVSEDYVENNNSILHFLKNSTGLKCDMDAIYENLDKRGKKVGSPTTRLLRRQHSQNLGEKDDLYINADMAISVRSKRNEETINGQALANPTIIPSSDDNNSLAIYANLSISPKMTDADTANSNFKNGNEIVSKIQQFGESENPPKSIVPLQNNFNIENGKDDSTKKLIVGKNGSETWEYSSETESGLDLNEEGEFRQSASSSCYSFTSSANSSSEEESESQGRNSTKVLPPHQPLPSSKTKGSNTKSANIPDPRGSETRRDADKSQPQSQPNPQSLSHSPLHLSLSTTEEGEEITGVVQVDAFDSFITNLSVESVQRSEKGNEGNKNIGKKKKELQKETDSIPLTLTPTPPNCKSVLTISVIDSTKPTPSSEKFPIETCNKSVLEEWYRSLRKGTVSDNSVVVTFETPKGKSGTDCLASFDTDRNIDINIVANPKKKKKVVTDQSGRVLREIEISQGNKSQRPHEGFSEHATMSSAALMTASIQDDKLPPSSGLLIETQNLWDTSPSPSSSPNSQSSEPELSSSSASDLSEISVTMTDTETRNNQFNRQETKYYDDVDEDGGFESFQVVDPDGDENDHFDVNSQDENDGQYLGISESAAHRQRTFAQLTQNIPEAELKQKASTVLDLINAEISDLHMRELELKKKNRIADGKQDYDNDSEDLVEEGSSQIDSDEYSDSAVDVESYSRTSNSSGNVTPAGQDREKSQDRDGDSASPQSLRGSYHPAEVENASLDHHEIKDAHLDALTSSTSSSMIVGIAESGTAASPTKQQGVKVRPIVEEEVKSIELSLENETPIEREIRLVKQREDDFKRQRNLSQLGSSAEGQALVEVAPKVKQAEAQVQDEPTSDKKPLTQKKSNNIANAKSFFSDGASSGPGVAGPKDLQYEMATARLKKEIEENLMRERELFNEGRLKSVTAPPEPEEEPTQMDSEEESGTATPNSEEDETFTAQIIEEKVEVKTISTPKEQTPTVSEPTSPMEPTINKTTMMPPKSAPPTATNNAFRFYGPAGYSRSMSSGGQPKSLPFSGNRLTSIEKMILKGSFSFNKNSIIMEEPQRKEEEVRMANMSMAMMPDPLQIVKRTESIDETEEAEVQEDIKPRRKYIPAQDKIQLELQEQIKREKELSQIRAKWKSTPDLSKDEDKVTEDEDDTKDVVLTEDSGTTKPSTLRRRLSSSTQQLAQTEDVTTSDVLRMNKPTIRRRNSALINQWEEMIKQQQQKNNKN